MRKLRWWEEAVGLGASGASALSIPASANVVPRTEQGVGWNLSKSQDSAHTHHHGDKGADVALLHDELEHRHHGVHFDTPLLLPAPLRFKLFFLIIVFLLLF